MKNVIIEVSDRCDTCIKSDVCMLKDDLDARVSGIKDLFKDTPEGFRIGINVKCSKCIDRKYLYY